MKNNNLLKICNCLGVNCLKSLSFTAIHQWKIWNGLVQLAILLSISMVLSIVLLYFINTFWSFYAYTSVGQQFFNMRPGISLAISDFLDLDVMAFSMDVTVLTFVFCLFVSAVFQLTYLLRYLYLPRNMLGRLILFWVPLSAVLARHIQERYGLENWNIAFAVALFPTLILFSGCFRFSHEHIPKIGDVITDVAGIVRKILNLGKHKKPPLI